MKAVFVTAFLWPSLILANPLALPAFSAPEQTFIREVETKAVAYFVNNAHPTTGLVLDRTLNFADNPADNRVASMASTGFGLAVVAHASKRGWIPQDQAQAYIEKVLRFSEKSVSRYRGWFLHFVDWETGESAWNSEYSTIDTALFIAGALYAAQIFPDTEIAKIAQRLYQEVDFQDMRTDGGKYPDKLTLSMGYRSGHGYIATQWHMYAEQMLLILLGLGHPTDPLPAESWAAFDRTLKTLPGGGAVMGLGEALFVHQYSHIFVDFRALNDGYKNYFQNSLEISRYHRQLREIDDRYLTLREGFWGFSAGDGPGGGYDVYTALTYKSTVCVGCAIGSYMFMPSEMTADMMKWMDGPYRSRIFGRYGFVDSLDLDKDWFGPWVLGITVAPIYLSIANADYETSVWKDFMQAPAMQSALVRIGQSASQHLSLAPSEQVVEPRLDLVNSVDPEAP